jgi:hypothetical protein
VTTQVVVGMANVPEPIRAADTFDRCDDVDVCTFSSDAMPDATAEQWARAALEESPAGHAAPRLWRLLGLRLGPSGSPHHVQGWRIADRGPHWVRLETRSWYATAHAVIRVDDDAVSLALFVRFDHRVAALIWPPVARLHRRGAPVMLEQAAKVLGRGARPGSGHDGLEGTAGSPQRPDVRPSA